MPCAACKRSKLPDGKAHLTAPAGVSGLNPGEAIMAVIKERLAGFVAATFGSSPQRAEVSSYASTVAKLLASVAGTKSLREKLLALQAGLNNPRGQRGRMVRRQLEEVDRVLEQYAKAEAFGRCAQRRSDALREAEAQILALNQRLSAASAEVEQKRATLSEREGRATPLQQLSEQQLQKRLAEINQQMADLEGELDAAEARHDDAEAQSLAERLHQVRIEARQLQGQGSDSPQHLRVSVLLRQAAEARQDLERAEAEVAQASREIGMLELRMQLIRFDEASAAYGQAAAAVVSALRGAGPDARLPTYWTVPRLVVAEPAHFPEAEGTVDGFTPTMGERVVQRWAKLIPPANVELLSTDPMTLAENDDTPAPAPAPALTAAA